MMARREPPPERAAHSDALHKEPSKTSPEPHRTVHSEARSQRGSAEQGVVKDERGQEQPADKKRATQNR